MVNKTHVLEPYLVICLIGVPLCLLLLKGPILKLFKRKEKVFPDGISAYIMERIVEIIEIFIGYLANTISFVRIAAFALAHVGLFMAVFSLADILKTKPAGPLLWVVTLVLGNLLIIALEGLIVTIQGIRLEYYEFFSKFFTSQGKAYQPMKLGEGVKGKGERVKGFEKSKCKMQNDKSKFKIRNT